MKELKFYITIPIIIFLFMASCSQSETVEPLFPEEIPSETLPASSYETPLDSVFARSDRFLGQMFMETRSSSVNRQVEINTLYRSIGTQTRSGKTEEIPVHIVNYMAGEDPAGYVLLIGDERIDDAVVAYSNENNWVLGTIPAFEDIFLERLDNYIQTNLMAYSGGPDDPIIGECQVEEWQEVGCIEKTILIPAKWGQEEPYNMHLATCEHEHASKMQTGCAATAMAQIMAYHKHPSSGNYISPTNGQQIIISYDWDVMTTDQNAITTQPLGKDLSPAGQSMVAHLMAECGYKVNMNYGCMVSLANATDIADGFNSMEYSCTYRKDFSTSTIITDLRKDQPVFMFGTAGVNQGHFWVIDGYQHTRTYWYSILTCESPTHEIEPEYSSGFYDSYYLNFNMGYERDGDGFYKAYLFSMPSTFYYKHRIQLVTDIYPS